MAILDSQGRLFGKISVLDIGAGLVIAMVLGGIFLFPGATGSSVAQVGVKTQPVEVDLLVRGLSVADPDALIDEFRTTKKTDIIIRNQPYGSVEVLKVEPLAKTIVVPQPDGSVKVIPDPRPEAEFSTNMRLTLGGKAQINKGEIVLGNSKLKIGTPIELEGPSYNFKGSVVGVKMLK